MPEDADAAADDDLLRARLAEPLASAKSKRGRKRPASRREPQDDDGNDSGTAGEGSGPGDLDPGPGGAAASDPPTGGPGGAAASDPPVGGPVQTLVLEALKAKVRQQDQLLAHTPRCQICLGPYQQPLVSIQCWHVHCRACWLQSLGAKKLCPQCTIITAPSDLRRIYL